MNVWFRDTRYCYRFNFCLPAAGSDVHNKFVNLRSVGKKPGGSEVIEES
ncbi:hypothetical protein KAW48_09470 [candidate division WOR-3 bacterium]|nr:hypothetical protein [candidate division WOR-3 bacterium]